MNKKEARTMPKLNNIKELIYWAVNKYSDNIAFTIKNHFEKEIKYKNISYKKMLEDINCLGTAMFNMNFKNTRIAVIGRNSYEWAISHISNLLGNNVSVPLDKELPIQELESSLIRSKANVIFFDEKYIDKIEELKNRGNTNLKEYICMNKKEGYKDIYTLIESGKTLIEEGYKDYINAKISEKEMGILLFTSGTTDKAKAVMLNQEGIALNTYDMLLVEKFYEGDVNIALLPYHHVFGSTAMIVMLAAGVKTVFADGLKYVQSNLKEYKVSVFVGVPILIEKIYEAVQKEIAKQNKTRLIKIAIKISNFLLKLHIDIRRKIFKDVIEGLGAMRFVISGGAPLDKNIAKRFNEMGICMVQGYGLTETSPVIAAETPENLRPGSIGFPLNSVETKFVNKDENGIGELIVKGPNVMLGYYEDLEKTNEVLKNGWFYTGDLGYIDKDGYIFLTGRKKDMIVLKNGKKVFPEELEILINKIDEVEESFVFGMPNEIDKNDLKVSVKIVYNTQIVEEKYNKITKEKLHDLIWEKVKDINKTLPKYKYIKNMILTDKPLIKTTTNKIKRNEEMKLLEIL